MALKLYDPVRKAFTTYTPSADGSLATGDLFLLNILIELKVMTHYLSTINESNLKNVAVGNLYEDPATILADVVAVT